MAEEHLYVETDAVFLGLTRPPMFFGITDVYAVIMTIVVMIVFLFTHGLNRYRHNFIKVVDGRILLHTPFNFAIRLVNAEQIFNAKGFG